MNLILYAIPGFIVLLLIEIAVDAWRRTGYYRANDAIASLSTGMLNQTLGFATKFVGFLGYAVLWEVLPHAQLTMTPLLWVLAFVLYDFCYYWSHRCQHQINFLWGIHVVHHQSEEFNLSTALRQPFNGFWIGSLFYLPLLFLGFPPEVIVAVGSLNLIYQYWVHTRFINTLGWLEKVLVTPMNHRVHHAINDPYIDRNFGGVLHPLGSAVRHLSAGAGGRTLRLWGAQAAAFLESFFRQLPGALAIAQGRLARRALDRQAASVVDAHRLATGRCGRALSAATLPAGQPGEIRRAAGAASGGRGDRQSRPADGADGLVSAQHRRTRLLADAGAFCAARRRTLVEQPGTGAAPGRGGAGQSVLGAECGSALAGAGLSAAGRALYRPRPWRAPAGFWLVGRNQAPALSGPGLKTG